MQWPPDADGDVLRRMEESGFKFSKTHTVDFNVDVEEWPPNNALLSNLSARFGEISVFEPNDGYAGYFQFQIDAEITYEFVIEIQALATEVAKPYGGVCESWGVMQQ